MKTKTQISTLIIALMMIFSTNTFASETVFNFEEESYIDDIPFNTEKIVSDINLRNIDFEEEAYIDDIPFNTESIVISYNYKQALTVDFNFSEEATIDDIEVNTALIACFSENAWSCNLSCATDLSNN